MAFLPASKSNYIAHFLVVALLSLFNGALCQGFPEGWTGHYRGNMNITNIRNKQSSIEVTLEIQNVIPDSTWSYYMCYYTMTDTVIKDYQIKRVSENQFLMDEGSIEIPMYFANGCFYDFYTIDSIFFTSVLTKTNTRKLEFNLYGGKLNTSEQTISREDENTVTAYLPVFSQRVTLVRRRKK